MSTDGLKKNEAEGTAHLPTPENPTKHFQAGAPGNWPVEEKARELTYGEKAVGLTFNPGNNADVEEIKRKAADLIDAIYYKNVAPAAQTRNGEVVAQSTLAIRRIQEGQMWAVKAITWQY